MLSPTGRSLAYLRRRGAMVAVTERWNAHAKVRQDLFKFCDVLAVVPGDKYQSDGVAMIGLKIYTELHPYNLAVQATSGDNVSHRLDKFREEPIASNIRRWLAVAGNRLQIHGWLKPSAKGRRPRWALRVVEVTAESLTP